jgi:tight adherence protein B
MLFPALTFGLVALIIVGAYWLVIASPEQREAAALRKRLKSESTGTTAKLTLAREEESLSQIGGLATLLAKFGNVSGPIKRMIDEADLPLTVGAFVLMSVAGLLLGYVIVMRLLGIWWPALIVAALLAALPTIVVRFIRSRRMNRFEEQFPEAIELISRALRAGHAFATGLKIAADEMPAPVGPEFKLLFEQQNYGAQIGDALKAFGQRIPLIDARFFVTAVMTQRETGGNLSEVLDRLASVMRERFRIRREVRVKSAHGRITAYILAGLPPTLAALMMLLNPDQMRLMFTEPLGQRMLMAAAVLQVVGTLTVRRLVKIEY